MNDPGIIEGRWWIHGLDQPAWLGALDLGNQLRLKVQAANEIGIHQVFERMAKQDHSMSCPLVVQGRDEHDKPVSLFGCGIPLAPHRCLRQPGIRRALAHNRGKFFDNEERRERDQFQDLFRTLLHELMTAKTRVHELELGKEAVV